MQAKREFLVRQYYTVSPNENALEEIRHNPGITYAPHEDGSTSWVDERFARSHRMFQAIMASEKALSLVSEYCVIREHEVQTSGWGYLEAHYDGKEPSFVEILAQVPECFQENDRVYLQKCVDAWANRDEDDDADPDDLDELRDCFKVEASGWNIEPHIHRGA